MNWLRKLGLESGTVGKYAALSAAMAIVVIAATGGASASELQPYHAETEFMLTPPGMINWEGYGFTNPATLTYVTDPDLAFAWRGSSALNDDLDKWGVFAAVPRLGFGAVHEKTPAGSVTDYRLGYALGNATAGLGVSYGWSGGDKDVFDRGKFVGVGTLVRPVPQVSIEVSGRAPTDGGAKEGVAALGLRPTGTDLVTLFADYALQEDEAARDGAWSAGAALRLLPGVHLTGRYFDKAEIHGLTAGLAIDIGRLGVASQAHYDNNQHRAYNTYRVRAGAYHANVIDTSIMPGRKYLELNLDGPIKYQRYRWFDESKTLADILSGIEAAKNDPRIAGIAVNTVGMDASREVAWEIREKLRDFKTSGKKVVVFLENGNIDALHFASIADKIVLDPLGLILIEGYVMGRTYLKGSLAKAGLAYDEWRFFTYKSAYESFSREGMSEADREQRQRLIDEYYNLAKTEICASGRISAEEFDRLVADQPILMAEEALAKGLVDTLARADAFKDVVRALEGRKMALVTPAGAGLGAATLAAYGTPRDDSWGDRPQIAVIYGIGECAMDTGIKARSLTKTIEGVTGNSRIKAVVFRADSPGGDALASDIVAEALKKCSEKKPVIVSQGAVAGSGGYWISMYGDKIVAAPQTITGSIGVIGGWIYNAGLKEKLGMTTDLVKAGQHADIGFGMTLPLIGVGVPDRNLNEGERTLIEHMIRTAYKDFVTKVADGRKMKFEDVDKIGQGRVWPGVDGKQNGLVDELGGLETALLLAKQSAGIARDAAVNIVELPQPELLDFGMFTPKLIGIAARLGIGGLLGAPDAIGADAAIGAQLAPDPMLQDLKFRLEHNGKPLLLMPMDDLDMVIDAQK